MLFSEAATPLLFSERMETWKSWGLEAGQEFVTTEFLSYMVKRGMLGGSVREAR